MISVAFVNFWGSFIREESWIYNFLNYHFSEVTLVDKEASPRILISSCFGPISHVTESTAALKIFYSTENILRTTDYADIENLKKVFDFQIDMMGDLENNQSRFYLPYFITCYPYYKYEKTQNIPTYIMNRRDFNLSKKKEMIATIVSSHDSNGLRKRIINCFGNHGKVFSPGKFMNNTKPIESYKEAKIDFISKSLFNICPENSYIHGYRSEKIFDALEAGTIPIYWGWIPQEDYLNNECFIYHNGSESGDELIEEALQNPIKYLSQRVFLDCIEDYLEAKYLLLRDIFKDFLFS